tara:strand:+ start:7483 stop:8226 length:744 start_codon:yes stop_codon:yes gene_type:complete
MNLIFVRHGQSEWNKENRFTGWVDVGLSERGETEATEAGNLLSDLDFIPHICYSSFLKRSKETATLILDKLANDDIKEITRKELWELNERHYGALQGLDKLETAKKYGAEQVLEWRRGYQTKPPLVELGSKFDPNLEVKYSNLNHTMPLGESLEDVVKRVSDSLKMIINSTKDGNVLVVAHGNSIRAMVKILEGISDQDIVEVNIPTGIPLAFNINDDKITRIGYLGDTDKIQKLEDEVKQQSRLKE